jgi:hypothetical protein
LKSHCKDFIDPLDFDCIWKQDVEALDYAIAAIRKLSEITEKENALAASQLTKGTYNNHHNFIKESPKSKQGVVILIMDEAVRLRNDYPAIGYLEAIEKAKAMVEDAYRRKEGFQYEGD